jgi:metacaspase-1
MEFVDAARERPDWMLRPLIVMFSACLDRAVASDGYTPESGGAFTEAFLEAQKSGNTFGHILNYVRNKIERSQIPQLSSNRVFRMDDVFDMHNRIKWTNTKDKVLLIGINYVGEPYELRGCHRDVRNTYRHLIASRFDRKNIRVLMDDSAHAPPTRHNILESFKWMTEDASAGDTFYVHYSGHGVQIPERSGYEIDGLDEAIVPSDATLGVPSGYIVDDEIYTELLRKLPLSTLLTVVMDCCHSGTIVDLPYIVRYTDSNSRSMKLNSDFVRGHIKISRKGRKRKFRKRPNKPEPELFYL